MIAGRVDALGAALGVRIVALGAGLLTPPKCTTEGLLDRLETFGHPMCGVGKPSHNASLSSRRDA